MGDQDNRIGKRLMASEATDLVPASVSCEMCIWLEKGYQRSLNAPGPHEAYATEILLHRRSFHVSSADNVN